MYKERDLTEQGFWMDGLRLMLWDAPVRTLNMDDATDRRVYRKYCNCAAPSEADKRNWLTKVKALSESAPRVATQEFTVDADPIRNAVNILTGKI